MTFSLRELLATMKHELKQLFLFPVAFATNLNVANIVPDSEFYDASLDKGNKGALLYLAAQLGEQSLCFRLISRSGNLNCGHFIVASGIAGS